jgi:hypothetical protein
VGNHSSDIVTENYSIIPIVISTIPSDGDDNVNLKPVINATFSESMDASTLNTDSFLVADEFGNPISGFVSYDAGSNTAIFTPDFSSTPLNPVTIYIATLTIAITDSAGNSLAEDYIWEFTTAGEITISINDENFAPVGGSAFTLTPNPFTLTGSLEVADNDSALDTDTEVFGEQMDGVIVIRNVAVVSYLIKQTSVPDGFTQLYDNMIVTVHPTVPSALLVVQNLNSSVDINSLTQFIDVQSAFLNDTQFQLYGNGNAVVGVYPGVPRDFPASASEILTVDAGSLQGGRFLTQTTLDQARNPPLQSVMFVNTAASANMTGSEIIDAFDIPTFPHPMEGIVNSTIYALPAFVIPYEESNNNFVLTPIIPKIFPGMTIRMDQVSFVESEISNVEQVNMTFNTAGNNVGFSFGISDDPPPGTSEPPLDAPALFLDIGFVGDVDFSDPNTFQSSPKIDILVNKTLPGFPELPNGCPDFKLLFFNGTGWEEVQKLDPTGDFTDQCPFTLEPEHFSKFAVGGVKGQTVSTEDPPDEEEGNDDRRRSGGGSRSTAATQTVAGNDVETTLHAGSDSITIEFETVNAGSGQVKVETVDISKLAGIFDQITTITALQDKKTGIVQMDSGSSFFTSGRVFDIDATAVKFQGMSHVTIPYYEEMALSLGSEFNVRFLHYDEENREWEDATIAINTEENTVTGMLESLSPVVAAIVDDGTFSEIYFQSKPLNRIMITDDSLPSHAILKASVGKEVPISTIMKNTQRTDQEYVFIVQIIDQDGVIRHINWHTGFIARGQSTNVSEVWTPDREGNYTTQIFIWDETEEFPFALSSVATVKIQVVG